MAQILNGDFDSLLFYININETLIYKKGKKIYVSIGLSTKKVIISGHDYLYLQIPNSSAECCQRHLALLKLLVSLKYAFYRASC